MNNLYTSEKRLLGAVIILGILAYLYIFPPQFKASYGYISARGNPNQAINQNDNQLMKNLDDKEAKKLNQILKIVSEDSNKESKLKVIQELLNQNATTEVTPIAKVPVTKSLALLQPKPKTAGPVPINPDMKILLSFLSKANNYTLSPEHLQTVKKIEANNPPDPGSKIALLSSIVQNRIESLQETGDCSGPVLKCGHALVGIHCGLGCQIHTRTACLMLSYVFNVPLIHDEDTGWPHSRRWSHMFKQLGSGCAPSSNENTLYWKWWNSKQFSDLYPLLNGLPVDGRIADIVEKYVADPFLWWVGQFIHYALQPNEKYMQKFQKDMASIGFKRPITGFHVRRTDKILEAGSSTNHSVDEYMKGASKYFEKQMLSSTVLERAASSRNRIYIASDDASILPWTRKHYTNFTIVGMSFNKTLGNQRARRDFSYESLRDILALNECDYVVCDLSSNFCALTLEILSYKYLNGMDHLTSLNRNYTYRLINSYGIPVKVVKVYKTKLLQKGNSTTVGLSTSQILELSKYE